MASTCFLSRRNLFLGSWDNEIISIQVIYIDNMTNVVFTLLFCLSFSYFEIDLFSHLSTSTLQNFVSHFVQHCRLYMMVLSFSPILGWLTS